MEGDPALCWPLGKAPSTTRDYLAAREMAEAKRRQLTNDYGRELLVEELARTRWPRERFEAEMGVAVDAASYDILWSEPTAASRLGLEAAMRRLRIEGEADLGRLEREFEAEKLLFLDIDGVLNRTKGATHIRLEADLVWRLGDITIRAGNVRIVLSSFWREFESYVAYVLRRHGVSAPVVGRTPGLPTKPDWHRRSRSAEIAEYLADWPKGTRYVILDDRHDAAETPGQRDRFVHTDHERGLTMADVDRAVAILLNQGLWGD